MDERGLNLRLMQLGRRKLFKNAIRDWVRGLSRDELVTLQMALEADPEGTARAVAEAKLGMELNSEPALEMLRELML